LKTGEDNETAPTTFVAVDILLEMYADVVNRAGVRRIDDCSFRPGLRAPVSTFLMLVNTTAKLHYSIPYSMSLARHLYYR